MQALLELTAGVSCKYNLIPFNPHPGSPFQPSHPQDILEFRWARASQALLILTLRQRVHQECSAPAQAVLIAAWQACRSCST